MMLARSLVPLAVAGLLAAGAPAMAQEPAPRAASTAAALPGATFRDCPDCPEMVVIPPGSFMMGSPETEAGRDTAEGPLHRVQLAKPFGLGRYDVTMAQYAVFRHETGQAGQADCSPQGTVDGRHPQVCVSWDDATAYAAWLSKKTGKDYRLPTEAEWEYAARAGTTTRYYWGDSIGVGHAVCAGCGSAWDNKQTAPVGSVAANPWGLYDMAGNVWQLTADCFNETYDGAPADGSAATGEQSCLRVGRGGSWSIFPEFLRVAFRIGGAADYRNGSLGFRLARALD